MPANRKIMAAAANEVEVGINISPENSATLVTLIDEI